MKSYRDVTQPGPTDIRFQLVLAGLSMVLGPIAVIISIVGVVRVVTAGDNPGGAIFFTVGFALLTVFAVARFISLKSGRNGKNRS